MTKIDIFSGFLGAGKTTLIKKLIGEAYAGEKVVLIENEFGEIGIDGGFLQDAGVNITEMNSGCICCSLVGDFSKALKEVTQKYSPERIIIEPSGVGKLSDVVLAVERANLQDAKVNALCSKIVLHQLAPAGLFLSRNFCKAISGQIHDIAFSIHRKVIHMDGISGLLTHTSKVFPLQNAVDHRGFANIGLSCKGNFRKSLSGKILYRRC